MKVQNVSFTIRRIGSLDIQTVKAKVTHFEPGEWLLKDKSMVHAEIENVDDVVSYLEMAAVAAGRDQA